MKCKHESMVSIEHDADGYYNIFTLIEGKSETITDWCPDCGGLKTEKGWVSPKGKK